MLGDFFAKPMEGSLCEKFCSIIMNPTDGHDHKQEPLRAQECACCADVVTSSVKRWNDNFEVECTETDVHQKAAVQRTWAEVAAQGSLESQ